MLKLFKWIYQLGYDKGYRDAVDNGKLKFQTSKTPFDDVKFMQEIDELLGK